MAVINILPIFTQIYPLMPHISLKKLPVETYQFILKSQGELKAEKKTSQYSLELTVIKLLKEIQQIKEGKKYTHGYIDNNGK